jgi:hypothetical protein
MTPKVAPKFSVCRVRLPVMGFLILAGVCLCLSRTYGPPSGPSYCDPPGGETTLQTLTTTYMSLPGYKLLGGAI